MTAINQNVPIPYPEPGQAMFQQLDVYTQDFLFTGSEPRAFSYPFKVEQDQSLAKWAVVGQNALGRLVPATVTESTEYFVTDAAIVNGGAGGANGNAVVTGTTGAGTMFQANVTIAEGTIVSIDSLQTEGTYTTPPTNDAAEPITGANLNGAVLSVTVETRVTHTFGVRPIGVLTQAINTAVGEEDTTVPMFLAGNFSIRALVWDPSFVSDTSKYEAFRGAPTPTNIVIRKRQSDL